MSDGPQSLSFPQFQALMNELKPYLEIWNETRATQRAAAAV
jgi:3-deoxy-D-arabino-heptulosonate 7-phosphate (DAHP) synthase